MIKNGNTGDVYWDDQRNCTQEDLIQIFSTFPNSIVYFDFLMKMSVHLEIKDIFVNTLKRPFHCTKKAILRIWVHGCK